MNFTNPKARLVNLDYCPADVRRRINLVLDSQSTHSIVKDVLRMGLNQDCVHVVGDVQYALDLLKVVRDSIT